MQTNWIGKSEGAEIDFVVHLPPEAPAARAGQVTSCGDGLGEGRGSGKDGDETTAEGRGRAAHRAMPPMLRRALTTLHMTSTRTMPH